MMSLVGMVLPSWTKYAALVALVLTIWGHGYIRGSSAAEEDAEELRAKEAAVAQADVQRLARAASEIEVVWINTTSTIREKARVITKEVPKYVTQKADTQCLVPTGFVQLWNHDLSTQPFGSGAPTGDPDAPTDLALSGVAVGVLEAKERFGVNEATLQACQAWVKAQHPVEKPEDPERWFHWRPW